MADKVHAAERTRQAIAAAENGDLTDARTLLAEALALDPEYTLAWLWFAAVAEDPGEEKFCLEQVRDLDPQHRASPSLARLRSETSECPPELSRIIDPPPPDNILGYADEIRAVRRRKFFKRTLVTVLVLALLAGVIGLLINSRKREVYLAVVVGNNNAGQLGGQEVLAAAQAAADTWNAKAPSDRQLTLVTFNDESNPAKAVEIAQQIVADGRYMGVIGHMRSTTSLAAAPIYKAAGIPAITPTATADAVTAGDPWYFRTVFDNTQQSEGIAIYAHSILKNNTAIIVSTDDPYGVSLREGFNRSFSKLGTVQADIVVSADPAKQQTELVAAADTIAKIPNPGVIALFSVDPASSVLGVELAKRNVPVRIVGSDALGSQEFFGGLYKGGAAAVNDSYAASPLTEGTLSGQAVTFYDEFARTLGRRPSWVAGVTYDAVDAFVEAMRRGDVTWSTTDLADDRQKVRDVLDSARSVETALPVLTGSLYFGQGNAAVRPVAFADGRVTPAGVEVKSAVYQLAPYSPIVGQTVEQEVAAGTVVQELGHTYTVQRVVTTGYNINEIQELDPATQAFTVDFFIWFKFRGSRDGPSDVIFPNAVDPALGLGDLQRSSTVDGENYELYRVHGAFRAPMQFTNFPFDVQTLPIVVQNKSRPSGQMTYIPDPDNLAQSQQSRLQSGTDANATIDQVPNWQADSVSFFPASVGNSGFLGDPSVVAGSQGITYSQMTTTTAVSRDVLSFLIKNLLPLVLLVIVTYVALWYPFEDANTRISFGVTGILTGAVLLQGVTASLPSVDYTVAIEWAFYAFIVLSGFLVLGSLFGQKLIERRQLSRARSLDRFLRIGYPVFVLGIAAGYFFLF